MSIAKQLQHRTTECARRVVQEADLQTSEQDLRKMISDAVVARTTISRSGYVLVQADSFAMHAILEWGVWLFRARRANAKLTGE
jgi:hypothetical protein